MTETRVDILQARVLRVAAIRTLETAAQAGRRDDPLMERAGKAVATLALAMAAYRAGPVLVLAGPGNNGGDALVAARELRRRGVDVRVALLGDGSSYRSDALLAWTRWREAAGDDLEVADPGPILRDASLVIDGLFGIGYSRAPTGKARDWIEAVNAARSPVLAIDIPSGVDADTGRVADVAIRADRTLSFLSRKPGLQTGEGVDQCGEVVVDLLGIDRDAALLQDTTFGPGDVGTLNRVALFAHAWRPRRLDSHKGSYGSVAIVGGHDGMVGAALLASRMALHGGAGRVYVRLLAEGGPGFDVLQPELMLRKSLAGVDASALAIGPGLGGDDAAVAALDEALAMNTALIVDADGLNAIAKHPHLADALKARVGKKLPIAVLTPHPLEAARLLGVDVRDVQADRIASACRLAERTASIVILKGAGSVIADPSGMWVINPTGNPALATGGTGDVLCGLVAGLLAQKLAPLDAARAATWLHGTAADDLVAAGIGPAGVTASELIVAIRAALNRLGSDVA